MESLRQSLGAYLEFIRVRLSADLPDPLYLEQIADLISSFQIAKDITDCENSEQFKDVEEQVRILLNSKRIPSNLHGIRTSLSTFFRKSGAYLRCLENKTVDPTDQFEQLASEIDATTQAVTHLALLPACSIPNNHIKCETFDIQTYSTKQLRLLLNARRNETVMGWPAFDYRLIANQPFLRVVRSQPINERRFKNELIVRGRPNTLPYLALPLNDNLRDAFSLVALFDWEQYWTDYTERNGPWPICEFDVSTSLSKVDEFPPQLRHLIGRRLEDFQDEESDPDSQFDWRLDDHSADLFRSLLQEMERCLIAINCSRRTDLDFIAKGMDFFLRGYSGKGFETFLWNIFVWEALVGRRKDTTSALKQRIPKLLHELNVTDIEVGNLYDKRSVFVHGRSTEQNVSDDEAFRVMRLTRSMLRKALRFGYWAVENAEQTSGLRRQALRDLMCSPKMRDVLQD